MRGPCCRRHFVFFEEVDDVGTGLIRLGVALIPIDLLSCTKNTHTSFKQYTHRKRTVNKEKIGTTSSIFIFSLEAYMNNQLQLGAQSGTTKAHIFVYPLQHESSLPITIYFG